MKLIAEDRGSPTWLRIKAMLEARREALRIENDGNHSPEATAKLRGRIAEVSAWIEVDRQELPVPDSPPVD